MMGAMRFLALAVLACAVACVTTADPDGQSDDPEVDGGSSDKDPPDARPRPDAGNAIMPRPDGGPPPVQLDAGSEAPKGKRIFVSSTTVNGNLKAAGNGSSGLDGADKICQGLATAANLGGTWKALVSTATQSGVERMSNVGPYYRLDGEKVFETREAMRTQPLVAIDVTDGLAQIPSDGAWTGTLYGGLTLGPATDTTCNDWQSASADHIALVGILSEISASWIDYGGGGTCDDHWHLYCVEQ
jgi:hypothetical protein